MNSDAIIDNAWQTFETKIKDAVAKKRVYQINRRPPLWLAYFWLIIIRVYIIIIVIIIVYIPEPKNQYPTLDDKHLKEVASFVESIEEPDASKWYPMDQDRQDEIISFGEKSA